MILWPILAMIIFDIAIPSSEFSSSNLFTPILDYKEQVKLEWGFKKKEKSPQKASESLGIRTTAKAAIVVDRVSGTILFQKEADRELPIASLTKLMTALVFLDVRPDWEIIVRMGEGENRLEGAKLFVKDGEEIRLRDLFYSSLVGSANNATQAMVHATGLSGEVFVQKMNEKAKALGMTKTRFEEPTGLHPRNTSTARDFVKLAQTAFAVPEIQDAVVRKEYVFTTVPGEPHRIRSQNDLLNSFLSLTGGKTGYTEEARHCLIVQAKNEHGYEIIAVVLGSETSDARFQEAKGLVWWAFENYRWKSF